MGAGEFGRHNFESTARHRLPAARINSDGRLIRGVVARGECGQSGAAAALGQHWHQKGKGHQGGAGSEEAKTWIRRERNYSI